MDFIVNNLPMILCAVAGIACLMVEAFMPGFGIPGISGIVLEGAAVALCWINLGPTAALILTLIALAILAVAVSMSLRSAARGRLSKSSMVLNETEENAAGYAANSDMSCFVGLTGTATTVLRPTGMAEFDGVKLNVVSDGEFIPAGSRVKIVSAEGSKILVKCEK